MGDLKNEKIEVLKAELRVNEYYLFNSFIKLLTITPIHYDQLNELNQFVYDQSILWCELACLDYDAYQAAFRSIQESGGGFSVLKLLMFIDDSITILKQHQQINNVIGMENEMQVSSFFKNAPSSVKTFIFAEYKRWVVFLFSFFSSRLGGFFEHPWFELLKANSFFAQTFSNDKDKELAVLIDLVKIIIFNFFYPYVFAVISELKENESFELSIATSVFETQENKNFIEEIIQAARSIEFKTNVSFFLKNLLVVDGNIISLQKLKLSYDEYSKEIIFLRSLVNVRAHELFIVDVLLDFKSNADLSTINNSFAVLSKINFFLDSYFNECQLLRKTSLDKYKHFAESNIKPTSLYFLLAFTMWTMHIRPIEVNSKEEALFLSSTKMYKIQVLPKGSYVLDVFVLLEVLVKFFFEWFLYLEHNEVLAAWLANNEKTEDSKLTIEPAVIKAVMTYLKLVCPCLVSADEIKAVIEKVIYSKGSKSSVQEFSIIEGMHIQLEYGTETSFQYKFRVFS